MIYHDKYKKKCTHLILQDNRPPPDSPTQGTDNNMAFKWATIAGIPLAIAFCGWLVTGSIERNKLDTDYVRIAVSILTPEKHTGQDHDGAKPQESVMALRGWAVRLLNARSPEAFTPAEQQALLNDGLRNPDLLSTLSAFQTNQLGTASTLPNLLEYAGGGILCVSCGLNLKVHTETQNDKPLN